MQHLTSFEEDYWLFIEAGFVATNNMDGDSAERLFHAAKKLKPDHVFSEIGFGYMMLCRLQVKQAEKKFKKILEKEPDNELVKALLGITQGFIAAELDGAEELLKELSKNAKDGDVATLARNGTEFIERFLRRTPGPADPSMHKSQKKK